MNELTINSQQSGLLTACESAAKSAESGAQVFLTWCIANAYGWLEARKRLSKTTWYRHKKLLRSVGVSVPKGDPGEVDLLRKSRSTGWLRQEDMESLFSLLSSSPGQIRHLLDQRFIVKSPWPIPGLRMLDGRNTLDPWIVGTTGIVCSINYNTFGWYVVVEHSNGLLDADQRWPEIPLQVFLQCTIPSKACND